MTAYKLHCHFPCGPQYDLANMLAAFHEQVRPERFFERKLPVNYRPEFARFDDRPNILFYFSGKCGFKFRFPVSERTTGDSQPPLHKVPNIE
jgi:hypothetical protein